MSIDSDEPETKKIKLEPFNDGKLLLPKPLTAHLNRCLFVDEKASLIPTNATKTPRQCPYLDTINRQYLDFDFEKLCSVSLTRINVYACLVCGKYFQGRGTNTYAYTHSVAESHHVFLNLQTLKFYCLPDNYEIIGNYLALFVEFLTFN